VGGRPPRPPAAGLRPSALLAPYFPPGATGISRPAAPPGGLCSLHFRSPAVCSALCARSLSRWPEFCFAGPGTEGVPSGAGWRSGWAGGGGRRWVQGRGGGWRSLRGWWHRCRRAAGDIESVDAEGRRGPGWTSSEPVAGRGWEAGRDRPLTATSTILRLPRYTRSILGRRFRHWGS
jgi:hypothetical protein